MLVIANAAACAKRAELARESTARHRGALRSITFVAGFAAGGPGFVSAVAGALISPAIGLVGGACLVGSSGRHPVVDIDALVEPSGPKADPVAGRAPSGIADPADGAFGAPPGLTRAGRPAGVSAAVLPAIGPETRIPVFPVRERCPPPSAGGAQRNGQKRFAALPVGLFLLS